MIYDAGHDSKLLETARAYFEHGGNLRKISEVLLHTITPLSIASIGLMRS